MASLSDDDLYSVEKPHPDQFNPITFEKLNHFRMDQIQSKMIQFLKYDRSE